MLISLFKYSRFLCCSTPPFCTSTVSAKTHHALIYILYLSLFLLHAKIATLTNNMTYRGNANASNNTSVITYYFAALPSL